MDLESRGGPRVVPEVVWRPCRGPKRLPEGSEGVPEGSNGVQEAAQADAGAPRGSTYTYLNVFARVYTYLMGSKDVPVGVCLQNTVIGPCCRLSPVVGGCHLLSVPGSQTRARILTSSGVRKNLTRLDDPRGVGGLFYHFEQTQKATNKKHK